MKQIENDVVKALLDYLVTRPYQEVAGAIQVLSNLKDVEVKEENNHE